MRFSRVITVRLLSLLFAAAWTLMPVATAVHSVQHAHHYCEEHQAFEESAGKSGVSRSETAQSAQVAAADESLIAVHESCVYPACSIRNALPGTPESRVDAAERTLASGVFGDASAHRSVAILHTAPKSSPPLA